MKTLPAMTFGACLATSALAACVISVGGSSCSWQSIHGSGIAATETRQVPAFRRIEIHGSAQLVARVGEPQSLTVTCDDNLISYVETEVRGDTLEIGLKPGSYSFHSDLEIELSVPELQSLAIHGSADADISGLSGASFEVAVSGSGDVRALGSVERLSASIFGSGDLDFFGVSARQAEVSISGSGDIAVQASERLEAMISGSGDVRYRGNPSATISVSGSGTVTQS